MTGKRKLYMFFGQLVLSAALVGIGKMSGAEFVSLESITIPFFIAGNVGEHLSRGKGDA